MAHSESKIITVLSVSFNSSFHLNRLFSNLIGKAHQPDKIQFLVVDNTNGEDEELSCSFDESLVIKIIKNEEIDFFNKLGNETFNLTNSLKLLLGKKIRIKANKNNE